MSTTKRNNNLTEKQLRGLDLVVKSLSKKYPFVKGWTFPSDWEKYQAHLYIDLYVNWDEVSKFYSVEFKPYYGSVKDTESLDSTSAILSFFGSYQWGSPEQEEFFERSYNYGKKIKDSISSLYEALPEEFQVFYDISDNVHFNGKSLCKLDVDHYLDYKKMK
jgi:hypothetical protein